MTHKKFTYTEWQQQASASEAKPKQHKAQHELSLQSQCKAWFDAQYPAYQRLLFHVKNEDARGGRANAINSGTGVVGGVADLIFLMPNKLYSSLCIELKYGKNKQRDSQRYFEIMTTAAQSLYRVVYSLEEFQDLVRQYMANIQPTASDCIRYAHKAVEQHIQETTVKNMLKERNKLNKIIKS